MWVLGTEAVSSARAASALNHYHTIPYFNFLNIFKLWKRDTDTVVHTYNPSYWHDEAGGLLEQ